MVRSSAAIMTCFILTFAEAGVFASNNQSAFEQYKTAYFEAHPGCLSFRSKRQRRVFQSLEMRLKSAREVIVVLYGDKTVAEFEDQHAGDVHGIYYTKCPPVDAKYNQGFNRAVVELESLIPPKRKE